MHIRRSDGDDVTFSHTTPNDNPTISPSRRPSTRYDRHVKDEEFGNGIEGVADEDLGTRPEEPQHVESRRKCFFSFVFNENKGSLMNAMIIMVLGAYKVKLGHEMKDEEELRDGAYTICAVMLFITAISMISYCDYLNPVPNIVVMEMVKRAQKIVQIPAFYCELFMYIPLIIIHSTVKDFKNLPIMPPAGFMYIPALNVIAIRSLRAAASETMASTAEQHQEEVLPNRLSEANMKLRNVALFQLNICVVTRSMNLMAAISCSNSLPFTPGLLLWIDFTLLPASAIAIYIGRHTTAELEEANRAISCQMCLSIFLRAGIQAIALAVMHFLFKRPIFSAFIFFQIFSLIDKSVLRLVNQSMYCFFAGIVGVSIGINLMMLKFFMNFFTSTVEEPSDLRHLAISVGVGCLAMLVNCVPLPECVVRTRPIDEELGARDRDNSLELGSLDSFMLGV